MGEAQHPRKRLAAALAPETSCFGIAPRAAAAAAHARPGRDPLAAAASLGLLAGSLLFSPVLATQAQALPASVDLAVENEFNDAVSLFLAGPDDARFGRTIASAGDINGDGIGDFVVGAPYFRAGELNTPVGAAYVVFGQDGSFAPANLTGEALRNGDGSLGFVIQGTGLGGADGSPAQLGVDVAPAGDFNGDGFDDLIVAAEDTQNPDSATESSLGAAYIIFGSDTGFPSVITPNTDLDGTNGVKVLPEKFLNGQPDLESVSGAGDVNGDGIDDVLVGTSNNDPGRDGSYAGAAWVVFGDDNPPALIDLENTDSTVALPLFGSAENGEFGSSVSGLGDINGDGVADFAVGAFKADFEKGRAYVLFGQATGWDEPITVSDDLNPSLGFAIAGEAEGDRAGIDLASAGDVNSDGFDDLLIGLSGNFATPQGGVYVLFGQESWAEPLVALDALSPGDGVKLVVDAPAALAYVGEPDGPGDFNGDGVDDIVMRANEPKGVFVVFGGTAFDGTASELDLQDVGTTELPGVKFSAAGVSGPVGKDVSGIGDINGDGRPDLAIGNFSIYNSDDRSFTGEAYVIFGGTTGFGEAPQADVDVTQLDFGTVSAQPGAEPVTVTNNGTAPLTFGTLSIAGDQAASFTLVNDQCSGQTLAVDATCTFSIQVTGADPGVQAAEVRLPSNAGDGVQTVPLSVQREQAPAQPVPALGSGLLALLAGLLGFLGLRRFPVSRSR